MPRKGPTLSKIVKDSLVARGRPFGANRICGNIGGSIDGLEGWENVFSVNFDGEDSYITIGDVTALNFERTDAFSFSVWLKTTQGSRSWIGKGWNPGYSLRVDGEGHPTIQIQGSNATEVEVEATSTNVLTGTWQHVVFTYDGTSTAAGVTLYVAGNPVATTVNKDTLNASILNDHACVLGALFPPDQENWLGHLDELSVWDKELSSTEVSEIYNTGSPPNLLKHSAAVNLVGWWRMGDDDTYPTIIDHSSSGNNGTMTNMSPGDIQTVVP